MTTQIYIEIDSASTKASEFILKGNGEKNPSRDALVQEKIGSITGATTYSQAAIKLYREYGQLLKQGKTGEAEATADAIAYFSLKQDIAGAKKDHKFITVDDFSEYRTTAVKDASKLAVADEKATAKATKLAAEEAEKARKAARTPFEQAFEEKLDGQSAETIGAVRQKFRDNRGRTFTETLVNLNNDIEHNPFKGRGQDPRELARDVLEREADLAETKGTRSAPAIVATAAVQAVVGGTAAAAEAPKPATKAAPAAAPKAKAAPAAGADKDDDDVQPARSGAWTPIKQQVQYDLALLGKDTGQKASWKLADGAASMDGKNGDFTGKAIKEWLAANTKFKDINDPAAQAELHKQAEAMRVQALAKAAAAPAKAAGTSGGRTAEAGGTATGPAGAGSRERV